MAKVEKDPDPFTPVKGKLVEVPDVRLANYRPGATLFTIVQVDSDKKKVRWEYPNIKGTGTKTESAIAEANGDVEINIENEHKIKVKVDDLLPNID